MEPFYDHGGITLYCGECSKVMSLFDWSIDLTMTSPPYDGLRDYKGYTFDFPSIAAQLWRVTSIGGVVVWVVADQTINGSETGTSFRQALGFMDLGFRLHDTMIWQRHSMGGAGNPKLRYSSDFEYMFILTKGKIRIIPNLITRISKYGNARLTGTTRKNRYKGDGGKDVKKKFNQQRQQKTTVIPNVWKINAGFNLSSKDKISFEHPATFPEALARDHILSWSNPGDLVLDPMCGSGTTLKMAQQLGRRAIGIEISEEYCYITIDRLRQPSFWSIPTTSPPKTLPGCP